MICSYTPRHIIIYNIYNILYTYGYIKHYISYLVIKPILFVLSVFDLLYVYQCQQSIGGLVDDQRKAIVEHSLEEAAG